MMRRTLLLSLLALSRVSAPVLSQELTKTGWTCEADGFYYDNGLKSEYTCKASDKATGADDKTAGAGAGEKSEVVTTTTSKEDVAKEGDSSSSSKPSPSTTPISSYAVGLCKSNAVDPPGAR
jgi:hypothetical protein